MFIEPMGKTTFKNVTKHLANDLVHNFTECKGMCILKGFAFIEYGDSELLPFWT